MPNFKSFSTLYTNTNYSKNENKAEIDTKPVTGYLKTCIRQESRVCFTDEEEVEFVKICPGKALEESYNSVESVFKVFAFDNSNNEDKCEMLWKLIADEKLEPYKCIFKECKTNRDTGEKGQNIVPKNGLSTTENQKKQTLSKISKQIQRKHLELKKFSADEEDLKLQTYNDRNLKKCHTTISRNKNKLRRKTSQCSYDKRKESEEIKNLNYWKPKTTKKLTTTDYRICDGLSELDQTTSKNGEVQVDYKVNNLFELKSRNSESVAESLKEEEFSKRLEELKSDSVALKKIDDDIKRVFDKFDSLGNKETDNEDNPTYNCNCQCIDDVVSVIEDVVDVIQDFYSAYNKAIEESDRKQALNAKESVLETDEPCDCGVVNCPDYSESTTQQNENEIFREEVVELVIEGKTMKHVEQERSDNSNEMLEERQSKSSINNNRRNSKRNSNNSSQSSASESLICGELLEEFLKQDKSSQFNTDENQNPNGSVKSIAIQVGEKNWEGNCAICGNYQCGKIRI